MGAQIRDRHRDIRGSKDHAQEVYKEMKNWGVLAQVWETRRVVEPIQIITPVCIASLPGSLVCTARRLVVRGSPAEKIPSDVLETQCEQAHDDDDNKEENQQVPAARKYMKLGSKR